MSRGSLAFDPVAPGDWERWLDEIDVPAGTPFLMSPRMEYDVELNAFFSGPLMVCAAKATQEGYARDLRSFLDFLWTARGKDWRDATEADHVAYLVWRRRDPGGPLVDDSTWDREVAAVNRFYNWQVRAGNVAVNPIPQRQCRKAGASRRGGWTQSGETAATYSHGAGREKIEWLPARSYRCWRDVGMRGYGSDGLPRAEFRGRWAARNATFCDLMVRTGLRLSEQAALSLFEVATDGAATGYQRFWLPPALAKGGSARWVYIPASVRSELAVYAEVDRAEVIAEARAKGRYRRVDRQLVVEDPSKPVVLERGCGGSRHRVKVSRLDIDDRRRLFIDGPDGLEPAAFWLTEYGMPVTRSTWKGLFAEANARCQAKGVGIWAHAHLLRHTFAVITLEQLQRGHIAALAQLDPEQRGHYTRVFGDPLDWVRRRLGHRSVTTTEIYLHALAELEMETRMALVPDGWDDPRDMAVATYAGDIACPQGSLL